MVISRAPNQVFATPQIALLKPHAQNVHRLPWVPIFLRCYFKSKEPGWNTWHELTSFEKTLAARCKLPSEGSFTTKRWVLKKDRLEIIEDGGRELNTNFFFSNFRAPLGYPGKLPGYPATRKFDFPGFEAHTKLFGPHPFTWKTPTPPENIRTQKFGFVLFFPWWEKKQTFLKMMCRAREWQDLFSTKSKPSYAASNILLPSSLVPLLLLLPQPALPRCCRIISPLCLSCWALLQAVAGLTGRSSQKIVG